MKKYVIILCFLLTSVFALTAQKAQFTIQHAVTGQIREFAPKKYYMPSWQPGTDTYVYFDYTNFTFYSGSVASKSDTEFMNALKINGYLEKAGIEKVMRVPFFEWVDKDHILFNADTFYVTMNIKTGAVVKKIPINGTGENQDYCVASNRLAYTIDNNLLVSDAKGISSVTKDDNKGIVNGKSVHRQEFGIEKGTFWSNSGNLLAFYRMDESMVTEYPIVDITQRIATTKNTRYPMAGMKSHEVTIGIYNCTSGKTIFLETGEPKEQYLTNIAWDPTDKFIYVAVLNREQNHMWFRQYDAATGKFVKTLFEEMHPKYVEPMHPGLFLNIGKDQFIWQSQRDGFNHLYLYNTEGRMLKQLTKGEWVVTSVLGIDAKDEFIYFESTKESPVERHIYKVSLKTGDVTLLTSGKGVHSAAFNSTFTHFFDTYSSRTIPNINRIVNAAGKTVKTIVEAKYPFEGYEIPKTSLIELTAADGKTKLYGRYTEPIRKDSSQKCPAIIYVYGGPHAQMVTDSWLMGGSLWEYYMAQKGYAVICVDNRGSSDRGLEFENVIFRQCGVAEAEDQMNVVEFLKSKPYVDPTRIGVHGWSYGGFMTTTLMTRYADTFKAGVAGGPVIDWKFYEVMYGERYMDTPEENPEGYAKTSLIDKGKLLKGKLLVIHGYQDETVVPQHSLAFIENCIKSKVQVDCFFYPTHEHNVRGMDRVHLMQKVTDYFDTYLK